MRNEKVRQISIDSISDPVIPIRTHYDQELLDSLARSIKDVGFINPIIVRPMDHGFEIVAGHRRFAAARILGCVSVPCIVRGASDFDADTIRLHENLSREDISPFDEAQFFQRLLRKHHLGVGELAEKIHRSRSYIQSRIEILGWDSVVQDAVRDNKIPFSAARWLAKIESTPLRRDYLKYAVKGGITTNQARLWYEASERQNLPSQPTSEKLQYIPVPEQKDYYQAGCEICGELIPSGEQGVFMAHQGCVAELREAVAEKIVKK